MKTSRHYAFIAAYLVALALSSSGSPAAQRFQRGKATRPSSRGTVPLPPAVRPGDVPYTPSEIPGVYVRWIPAPPGSPSLRNAGAPGSLVPIGKGLTAPDIPPPRPSPTRVLVRKSLVPGTGLVAYIGDQMTVLVVARLLPSGEVVMECRPRDMTVSRQGAGP